MKKNILDFRNMKLSGEKILMLTAYDYPSAHLAEKSGIEMILVGDSLGMVVLGYDSTVPVSMDEMLHHSKAVRRGASTTFIIADLPFMSYTTEDSALMNAGRFLKEGGVDAVKLEGGEHFVPIVESLVKAGIPVVGHIGLTPQTAGQLGGFKVQGRDLESVNRLRRDALALQSAGVFALVLEAIPWQVAEQITNELSIPTIGIGAGAKCNGQVLVYHDLLGLFDRFKPKFVKQYASLGVSAKEGIKAYIKEVKTGEFPDIEHSFSLADEIVERLYGGS